MFSSKKEKKYARGTGGFTLVELMVVIAIFVLMTALLVARYGSFDDTTILTNTAYDVALAVRDAQSYGLNVQGVTSGAAETFASPYGMDFNMSDADQMTLFADSYPLVANGTNGDGIYESCPANDPACTTADILVTTYTLSRGAFVESICAGTGPGAACTPVSTLDVTFKRPDPNAIIVSTALPAPAPRPTCLSAANPCAYAEIVIENGTKTSTRTITVQQTGEIAVENQ